MAENTYERLLRSDEIWFPEGQPIGAAHDELVGEPVDLDEPIKGEVAYTTKVMTDAEGRVSVEYVSPDDPTLD